MLLVFAQDLNLSLILSLLLITSPFLFLKNFLLKIKNALCLNF
jgi:hypothetical protein